jgi:hypothetical protein
MDLRNKGCGKLYPPVPGKYGLKWVRENRLQNESRRACPELVERDG